MQVHNSDTVKNKINTLWNTKEGPSPALPQVGETKYCHLHFSATKGRQCNGYGTRLKLGTCGAIHKFATDSPCLLWDCIYKKTEMPSSKIQPLKTPAQFPSNPEGA